MLHGVRPPFQKPSTHASFGFEILFRLHGEPHQAFGNATAKSLVAFRLFADFVNLLLAVLADVTSVIRDRDVAGPRIVAKDGRVRRVLVHDDRLEQPRRLFLNADVRNG